MYLAPLSYFYVESELGQGWLWALVIGHSDLNNGNSLPRLTVKSITCPWAHLKSWPFPVVDFYKNGHKGFAVLPNKRWSHFPDPLNPGWTYLALSSRIWWREGLRGLAASALALLNTPPGEKKNQTSLLERWPHWARTRDELPECTFDHPAPSQPPEWLRLQSSCANLLSMGRFVMYHHTMTHPVTPRLLAPTSLVFSQFMEHTLVFPTSGSLHMCALCMKRVPLPTCQMACSISSFRPHLRTEPFTDHLCTVDGYSPYQLLASFF